MDLKDKDKPKLDSNLEKESRIEFTEKELRDQRKLIEKMLNEEVDEEIKQERRLELMKLKD